MKRKVLLLENKYKVERDQKEIAWGVQDKMKAHASDIYYGAKELFKENRNLIIEIENKKKEVESIKKYVIPDLEKQLIKNHRKEISIIKKNNNVKVKRMESTSKRKIKKLENELKSKRNIENQLEEERKYSRVQVKKLDWYRKNLSYEKRKNKSNKDDMLNIERELSQTMNENQLLRSELESESQVRHLLEEELTEEIVIGKVLNENGKLV